MFLDLILSVIVSKKCSYERATEIKLFESQDQQFPGEPWIRFCNSYFEVYIFFPLTFRHRASYI
jgi:hypothetical protein